MGRTICLRLYIYTTGAALVVYSSVSIGSISLSSCQLFLCARQIVARGMQRSSGVGGRAGLKLTLLLRRKQPRARLAGPAHVITGKESRREKAREGCAAAALSKQFHLMIGSFDVA